MDANPLHKSLTVLVIQHLILRPNEPVEKVTLKKTASSAESKIGNYFLSSKVFTILWAMFLFP
jgi:hypothetical protein